MDPGTGPDPDIPEHVRSETTAILSRLGKHDELPTAADTDVLFRISYDELRRAAAARIRAEREGDSLDATGLIAEVYLRLVGAAEIQWRTRAHFLAICARAMRQVLIDRARKKRAIKHGGNLQRVMLDSSRTGVGMDWLEVIAIDQALESLSEQNERAGRVAELRIFGGLSADDIAHALGVSRRTAYNDWRAARAWLRRRLADSDTQGR